MNLMISDFWLRVVVDGLYFYWLCPPQLPLAVVDPVPRVQTLSSPREGMPQAPRDTVKQSLNRLSGRPVFRAPEASSEKKTIFGRRLSSIRTTCPTHRSWAQLRGQNILTGLQYLLSARSVSLKTSPSARNKKCVTNNESESYLRFDGFCLALIFMTFLAYWAINIKYLSIYSWPAVVNH